MRESRAKNGHKKLKEEHFSSNNPGVKEITKYMRKFVLVLPSSRTDYNLELPLLVLSNILENMLGWGRVLIIFGDCIFCINNKILYFGD